MTEPSPSHTRSGAIYNKEPIEPTTPTPTNQLEYFDKLTNGERQIVNDNINAKITSITNEFINDAESNPDILDQVRLFYMDEGNEIDREQIEELLDEDDIDIEEAMEMVLPTLNLTSLLNDILVNHDLFRNDKRAEALTSVFESEKEKYINNKINEISKTIFENRKEPEEPAEQPAEERRFNSMNVVIEDIFNTFDTALNLYDTNDYQQQVGKLGISYADNNIVLNKIKKINKMRKRNNKKQIPFILPIEEEDD